MEREDLVTTFEDIVAKRDDDALRDLADTYHLADLAEALADMPDTDTQYVLSALAADRAGELIGFFPPEHQARLLAGMDRPTIVQLFRAMDADDQADVLQHMDETERVHILPALAQAERDAVLKLAAYDKSVVGAEMTSEYVTLEPNLTARAAIRQVREQAPNKETIYQTYVIDDQRHLIGTLSLRELIVAPPDTRVGDLMRREVVYARADDPRRTATDIIARYDLIAVPVIDNMDRLVGIVTYDDAMDVDSAETTDMFHKAGGSLSHMGISMRDASIDLLYRKRIVWLILLVFANIFSGAGIAAFEDTIAAHVALVFFLPLLIDSGGNAGSQASTLMVRALATGDARMQDWGRMLGREFFVALLLGLSMAAAVSLIGIARAGTEIAMVVAMAMVLIVIVGSLIGMSIPFVLSRLGRDPATASAPLITSIADITGVLIYFAIASAVLPSVTPPA